MDKLPRQQQMSVFEKLAKCENFHEKKIFFLVIFSHITNDQVGSRNDLQSGCKKPKKFVSNALIDSLFILCKFKCQHVI